MSNAQDDQQPAEAQQPDVTTPEQTEEPKKGSALKKVARAVAVPVIAFAGFGIYNQVTSVANNTEVGDCLAGEASASNADLKTVGCESGDALFKVIAKFDGQSEADFDNDANVEQLCASKGEWDSAYWEGTDSGDGTILCLTSL